MKSKKQGSRCVQAEECGVWLDTAELKKRSHQTVIPCTYSSRFNPLLRRQHVESSTFEFTQTKTPQLCTKQTSMYAFFTPKGKKVAMPTSQENSPRSLCMEGKADENDPDPLSVGLSADYIDESPARRNTTSCNPHRDNRQSATLWEEMYDTSSVAGSFAHPNDLLQTNSVKPENVLYGTADLCTTSTKQHTISLLDSSICSHSPEVQDKELYTESQLDSQLFTQDSQGNRVIAHRAAGGSQKICCTSGPLQDRTNVPWDTASPMKRSHQYLCDEESLRFMFTQDSEGNKVIKH